MCVMYTVDEDNLKRLDQLEGYPGYYNRVNVEVKLKDGSVADCLLYRLDDYRKELLELPHLKSYSHADHAAYVPPADRPTDVDYHGDVQPR